MTAWHHRTSITGSVATAAIPSKVDLRAGDEPTMAAWRKRLFIATSHITADAAGYFGLPLDQTVIIGARVEV